MDTETLAQWFFYAAIVIAVSYFGWNLYQRGKQNFYGDDAESTTDSKVDTAEAIEGTTVEDAPADDTAGNATDVIEADAIDDDPSDEKK